MSSSVRLVLLSLSLFLVLLPLAAGRPGQPPALSADEPAYFLAALSLVEDGDLRCDLRDVERAFEHYPFLPLNNLILMSPDGWETVYFGKPFVYSLLAAPAAALVGANGFAAFNMLLLVAMIWMGTAYLRRFNPDAVAALFAAAFFLLSTAFAYAFWVHPEILNMFSVAACLYLAFHWPESAPEEPGGGWRRWRGVVAGPLLRPLLSGAVLALGVYNKPMLAALGIPALWLVYERGRLKSAGAWLAGAALAMAAIIGVSVALTGQGTAYLGADRGGLIVPSPREYTESLDKLRRVTVAREEEAVNSWTWLIGPPDTDPAHFLEDFRYFLVGRHTGLVPYMPFAALAILLFLLHGRRSPERWLTFGALGAVALYFLLWIPFNWHGGGGFIGNRYFVNVYPGFLFLVTAVRPLWLPAVGSGAAAVLLGSILFSPWGAPVPEPTMQFHVRGGVFPFLPLELSLRHKIPGYESFGYRGVGFFGRRDAFEIANESTGSIWVRGATRTEVWLFSAEPLERLIFDVTTWSPDNEIVLELPGVREVLRFSGAEVSPDNIRRVDLRPSGPTRLRRNWDRSPEYAYRLLVTTRTGRHQGGNMMNVMVKPLFYIGAQLDFIGTDERVPDEAHYRIGWLDCRIPERVEAGASFEMPLTVRNDSQSTWGARGVHQVNLVYRWLDASGTRLEAPRGRNNLQHDVRPGESVAKLWRVETPPEPGSYVLVFDAIRRHAALFSRRGGETCQAPVRVVAASADGEGAG